MLEYQLQLGDGVSTGSGSDRVAAYARNRDRRVVTRSHPPPHASCPRGDPGPLPVLTSFTEVGTLTPLVQRVLASLMSTCKILLFPLSKLYLKGDWDRAALKFSLSLWQRGRGEGLALAVSSHPRPFSQREKGEQ